MIDYEPVYRCEIEPETELYIVESKGHLDTLTHHVRHSPSGFSYGYNGSGAAELARSILISYLGNHHPHPALYQEFKQAFLAPLNYGDPWSIDGSQIRAWLQTNAIAGLPWLEPASLMATSATVAGRQLEENYLRERFGLTALPSQDDEPPDRVDEDV